jgi:putative ABC transport system permease protein
MRILIANHIQNARHSLRSSRVRSTLTMLGVTIGVSSITAILALSGGASTIVDSQIDELGGNIAVIRPGGAQNSLTSIATSQTTTSYASSTLTEKDAETVSALPNVETVAPLMIFGGTIRGDSTAPGSPQIVATYPGLAKISNLDVREGQFLDKNSRKNSVVLGSQLSINIFGTESSVGRLVSLKGENYTVIGVLQRMNNPYNYNSVDFDNVAVISMSDGKQLNNNILQIQQINVRTVNSASLNSTVDAIKSAVSENHGGESDFTVLTGNKIAQPNSQLFLTIAGGSTAIAAISLLVGGIGIMNIMLVTVAERTREIGIRKALGASNVDISMQFLIESLVISISGGISGYIIGYIMAFTISSFLTFDPVFSWEILGIALSISIVMGTVFGLYPAVRAASKDPVESLYQYK